MSSELKVEGLEELQKKIVELGRKGSRIENEAIKKAAEPILNDAKANAPVDTGKGREGLKISKVRKKDGQKYVLVGIEKGDISEIFYMKFHEWGASAHSIKVQEGNQVAGGILKSTKNKSISNPGLPARPFLGPAYEKNKRQAIEIIKEEFRKGLGIK